MNNVLKTASILTSGILVGMLVRKLANTSWHPATADRYAEKNVKVLFDKGAISEDINNYFV